MKKIRLIFAFVLVFALSIPQVAYANMAAPKEADIGSSITFENNDAVSVLSEALDITVNGSETDIVATYKMKNTTDESISIQSMFLSPNIENSGVKVVVNDKDTSFTVEAYALNYDTEIKTNDWQYVVLTDSECEMKYSGNYVSKKENNIVLRKATNSDIDEILRQNSIYFGDISGIIIMPEDDEKRNRVTYMVELDSQVIGKIRVEVSGGEGFLSGFGILPQYRSKGYGKQTLKAILYIRNENCIYNVALEVATQNMNALNLYKSCGFVEESITDYYEVSN